MSNTLSNNSDSNFAVSEQAWIQTITANAKKPDAKPSWGKPAPRNYQTVELLNAIKVKQEQANLVKQPKKDKIFATSATPPKVAAKQQPISITMPKDMFARKAMEFRYLQQVKLWLKQAGLNPDMFTKMQKLILPSIILQLQTYDAKQRNQILQQVSQAQISGTTGLTALDKFLLAFISAGKSGFDLNHLAALDNLCADNITMSALPKVNRLGLAYLRDKVAVSKRSFSIMKVNSSPVISQALEVMEAYNNTSVMPHNIRDDKQENSFAMNI